MVDEQTGYIDNRTDSQTDCLLCKVDWLNSLTECPDIQTDSLANQTCYVVFTLWESQVDGRTVKTLAMVQLVGHADLDTQK